METFKIKILKDTPFDLSGTEMLLSEFRLKYGYICSKHVSDGELIDYLKTYNSHPSLSQTTNYCVNDWFKVVDIPLNEWRCGDWVWHEKLKKAFCVVIHNIDDFKPNYVTFEAANTNVDIYKRKATQEEIDYYDLVYCHDKTILIGQYKCYYKTHVWKEITGIISAVRIYKKAHKSLSSLLIEPDTQHKCSLDGIKVGCKNIQHSEVMMIAKQLNI